MLGQLHNYLKAEKLSSVKEMLTKMGAWVQDMRRIWDTAIQAGWITKPDARPRDERDKQGSSQPQRNPKRQAPANPDKGDRAEGSSRKGKDNRDPCSG